MTIVDDMVKNYLNGKLFIVIPWLKDKASKIEVLDFAAGLDANDFDDNNFEGIVITKNLLRRD